MFHVYPNLLTAWFSSDDMDDKIAMINILCYFILTSKERGLLFWRKNLANGTRGSIMLTSPVERLDFDNCICVVYLQFWCLWN